jgi:hypothetical protein
MITLAPVSHHPGRSNEDRFALLLEPVLLHVEAEHHPVLVLALLIPVVDFMKQSWLKFTDET